MHKIKADDSCCSKCGMLITQKSAVTVTLMHWTSKDQAKNISMIQTNDND